MLRLARILRDYREAGAANELIALWGFVDGGTFLTKAGHVGLVYRIAASTSRASRTRSGARWSIAWRRRSALLDERCRVYQYVVEESRRTVRAPAPCARTGRAGGRRRRAADLNAVATTSSRLEHFLVLVYEASPRGDGRSAAVCEAFCRSPATALRDGCRQRGARRLLEADLDRAVEAPAPDGEGPSRSQLADGRA